MDSAKALGNVPETRLAFWFNNGAVAKNIYEFRDVIAKIDSDVFKYHANPDKNDFYNWILEVIGDAVLARRVKTEFDKKKFAAKLRERIKELEKMRGQSVLAVH